jgi:hypothetical protein
MTPTFTCARPVLLSISLTKLYGSCDACPRRRTNQNIATQHFYTVAMAFSFGFSGDDIEEDPNDAQGQEQQQAATSTNAPPPIPARTHDLDEMVCKKFCFRLLYHQSSIPSYLVS